MPEQHAPGGPGIAPRWTSSAKDGIGTAYHTSSRIWFTLSHGIINEIYYPHVDTPNTRDMQLLITDGETFFHEEKRDLEHTTERPNSDALLYRITNSDPEGRYRIIKNIITEPHSPVVLMSVKVEVLDSSLKDKLQLYVLLAPHLKNTGEHNSARCLDLAGQHLLQAEREGTHLVLGCSTDFKRRSVGYVGASDGWRDLTENYQMDWEYHQAEDGNIAMMGEISLPESMEFQIGVSLGDSCQSAATQLLQAFVRPFDELESEFVKQWKRTKHKNSIKAKGRKTKSLLRLSQCVLLAHEDKVFSGATVASMSIPWGESKDDSDQGGYHLVWARDMVQTTTALMACGEMESPLRALLWLACVQGNDGNMPQNSTVLGIPYWSGLQLDEVAVGAILAWRLDQAEALQNFNPQTLVTRSARFLMLHGPVTGQERWEENSGYSPSTLATVIASLICTAELIDQNGQTAEAGFLREYCDWLVASLEVWMVTDCGDLVPRKPRHYIRITPEIHHPGPVDPDPNSAMLQVGNGGGEHPARNVVDGGFLQLVRLGIVAADDPVILDSIAVIDAILKRDLPQGPCWRRYNHDGYGQYPDGRPFDESGEGRSWPLLTGERGHYELAAGGDPLPYIKAMEGFANAGGLLTEQLWDAEDLPDGDMKFGQPTGSAMPLCWAHAEYISLVRSYSDGVCFDRIEPVYQRYTVNQTISQLEFWTFAHQPAKIPTGKRLRILCDRPAIIHWSSDDWATTNDLETVTNSLNLFYVDLPVEKLCSGSTVVFTFHWLEPDEWEGSNYSLQIH